MTARGINIDKPWYLLWWRHCLSLKHDATQVRDMDIFNGVV